MRRRSLEKAGTCDTASTPNAQMRLRSWRVWLSRCHNLQLGRHFRPYLMARLSSSSVGPPFLAVFVGSAVAICSRAVIFGRFCRLGCRHLQSGRHFRPFLSAQLSSSAVGPPFSAVFVGSAVVTCSRAAILGRFCRLRYLLEFRGIKKHLAQWFGARWVYLCSRKQ